MGLQTINTIQSGINSNYSDRYIKQALANLGQRTGAKGDSIINSSFKLKDLLPIESNNYMVATYINNDKIRLQDSSNENNYCELSSINEVSNVLIKLLESVPSQQSANNIKQLSDVKILKNPDSYFFIGKCIDTSDFLDSIICFEFSEETEQLINGIVIVPKSSNISYYEFKNVDNNIVIVNDRVTNIISASDIDSIYSIIIELSSTNSIVEELQEGVTVSTTDILSSEEQEPIINKLKYYTLNFPKYVKASFNNIVYYENDSYDGLKKSIVFKFIDEVFNNSGYPIESGKSVFIMYFPKEAEFFYIINENTRAIYFSYDISVYYNTKLKANSDINNELSEELKNHIVSGHNSQNKISIYKFIVNYINEDKYIDNIVVNKIQTLPFIQENKETEENVWVLNDVETDIPATGEDAGNPNIMMLSFTKQNDNSQVQILHTYDDHSFKETIEEYYKNNSSLVECSFDYDSDFLVNVNNKSSFEFKINLPDINSLLDKNTHYGKIIKNTLLWTFVDLKYSTTTISIENEASGEVNNYTLNELVHGVDTNGNDPGKSSFITVFWQVVKNDNGIYSWKFIPNYLFSKTGSDKDLPALDLSSMMGLKDMINYYLNNLYEPDKFLHSWLVFDPIFTSEKQTGISPEESLQKTFYPLFKVDASNYYDSNPIPGSDLYNNNLNIVPKFLKQKQNNTEIIDFDNSGQSLIENINDIDVNDNYFNIDSNNEVSSVSKLNNGDYVPNSTETDVYPIFDFREVLTFNQTLINRLDIVSFDKNKKAYHAFIGHDSETDPSILTIGTSDKNKSMSNSQTLPDSNFAMYDRICVDMPLNETEDSKFEKLIINKDSNGNYFSIVTIDRNNTEYIQNEISCEIPATKYMEKLTVGRKLFFASRYVSQFKHLVLDNQKNITCEVINNTDEDTDHGHESLCAGCSNNTFGYERLSFILYFDKVDNDYRVSLRHCEQIISSSNYILGPTSDTGTIDIPLGVTLVSNPTGTSCVKLRYYIKKDFIGSSGNFNDYFDSDGIFKPVKLKYSYSPYLKYGDSMTYSLNTNLLTDNNVHTEKFYGTGTEDFYYIEFSIPFNNYNTIYFISGDDPNGYSPNEFININCEEPHNVSGNIESLIKDLKDITDNKQTPEGRIIRTIPSTKGKGIFCNLFAKNKYILNASSLRLPLTIDEFSYYNMFIDCENLISAPSLNSTQVRPFCYCGMFKNCKNLLITPELNSEDIDICCYENMFYNCESITKMPQLKSNKIAPWCYVDMFRGCSLLEDVNIKHTYLETDNTILSSFYSTYYIVVENGENTTIEANDLGKFYSHQTALISDNIIFTGTQPINFCQSPFKGTFQECSSLKDLSHIKISVDSTINSDLINTYKTSDSIWNVFARMFKDCVSLEKIPTLQKTKISHGDFQNVFNSCVSLKEAILPGFIENTSFSFYNRPTISNIYNGTFDRCVSLEKINGFYPNLKTVSKIYYDMFKYCVSLKEICELNVSPVEQSYVNMFYGCKSLTSAVLKFNEVGKQGSDGTLSSCSQMFKNCSNLNNVEVEFTDWNNKYKYTGADVESIITNGSKLSILPTYNWMDNVAEDGTFVCYTQLPHSTEYLNNPTFIPWGKVSLRPDKNNYFFIDVINREKEIKQIEIDFIEIESDIENILELNGNLEYFIVNTDEIGDCNYCYNSGSESGFTISGESGTEENIFDGPWFKLSNNKITIVDVENSEIENAYNISIFGEKIRIYFKYNSDEISTLPFGHKINVNLYKGVENSIGIIEPIIINSDDQNIIDKYHFHIGGDIVTLLKSKKYNYITDKLPNNAFESLFESNYLLTTAEELKLPEHTISDSCYKSMFTGCINLIVGPLIKCKSTANSCYESMFNGCKSFKSLARLENQKYSLPAESLSDLCYYNMFFGCTSLTETPELPATILARSCYAGMFSYCTSLTTPPELISTTLANSCYKSMFSGCTNLETAPELPATILFDYCYAWMFSGCTSLTETPLLEVTSLANSCYGSMFFGCENLSKITLNCKIDNVDVSLTDFKNMGSPNSYPYTGRWVEGVLTEEGQFIYNNEDITEDSSYGREYYNDNLIPEKWYKNPPRKYLYIEPIEEGETTISINTDRTSIKYYIDTNKELFNTSNNGEDPIKITNWKSYSSGQTINCNNDDIVYFAYINGTSSITSTFGTFNVSNKFNVGGDILTIYSADVNKNQLTIDSAFKELFDSSKVVNASKLILPDNTCTSCYAHMFNNCNNLEYTPELPATVLKFKCYDSMFESCSILTNAPDLSHVTIIEQEACTAMFNSCVNLTNISDLSSITKIERKGCNEMFTNCSSLIDISQCSLGNVNTELFSEACYGMFKQCSSLVNPINLPIKTLVDRCYNNMFENCSSLMSLNVGFEQWNDSNTSYWVVGVNTYDGIFTGPETLGINVKENYTNNRIPINWWNPDYLTFETTEDCSIYLTARDGTGNPTGGFDPNLQYKIINKDDNSSEGFKDYNFESTIGDSIPLSANQKLIFVSKNTDINNCKFSEEGRYFIFNTLNYSNKPNITVSGNIYSLVYKNFYNIDENTNIIKPYMFDFLFYKNSTIKNAKNLKLLSKKLSYDGIVANDCYSGMFCNCTSLTDAPELPAETLADHCYDWMFSECTSLRHIKVSFTDWNNGNYTHNWFSYISQSGTFKCPTELTIKTGESYIPEGWIVENF